MIDFMLIPRTILKKGDFKTTCLLFEIYMTLQIKAVDLKQALPYVATFIMTDKELAKQSAHTVEEIARGRTVLKRKHLIAYEKCGNNIEYDIVTLIDEFYRRRYLKKLEL